MAKPKNNLPLPQGRLRRSPDERIAVCKHCASTFVTKCSRSMYCSTKCIQAYRRANLPLGEDQQERARVRARAWYAENKERAIKTIAGWQESNSAKVHSYKQKWANENKDYSKAKVANRRAIIKSRPGKVTRERINELMVLRAGKCACCMERLTDYHADHIMPLALGGDNTNENLQLLCPSCNLSKSAKHPVEFMQQRGYLL